MLSQRCSETTDNSNKLYTTPRLRLPSKSSVKLQFVPASSRQTFHHYHPYPPPPHCIGRSIFLGTCRHLADVVSGLILVFCTWLLPLKQCYLLMSHTYQPQGVRCAGCCHGYPGIGFSKLFSPCPWQCSIAYIWLRNRRSSWRQTVPPLRGIREGPGPSPQWTCFGMHVGHPVLARAFDILSAAVVLINLRASPFKCLHIWSYIASLG